MKCLSNCSNPFPFSNQQDERIISPDLIVVRNFGVDLHNRSYRNVLIGIAAAGIACVNGVDSLLLGLDRALTIAALRRIQRKIGRDKFPFIDVTYHDNIAAGTGVQLIRPASFPVVVKVGSTHAGVCCYCFLNCLVHRFDSMANQKSTLRTT